MRRYGGELIHCERDAEGALEIVDTYGVRALHFGTSPRQSAMALDQPERLELAYIRAMLSALLFIEEPERILVLGLGGGSLVKFLLAQFPQCRIVAVERRAAVVRIAHDYFFLPRHPKLSIHIAEALDFVGNAARNGELAYDLILVDAYDPHGMDSSVNADEFFAACARLLDEEGALSINLWGTQSESLKQSTDLLRAFFPRRCYKLAVPNKGNIIGLGLGAARVKSPPGALKLKARTLQIRQGLEMPYFLRNLKSIV